MPLSEESAKANHQDVWHQSRQYRPLAPAQRRERSGEAKTGYQQGPRHRIQDWDAFTQFVEQHGNKTQAELAELWSEPINQPDYWSCAQADRIDAKKKTYRYREHDPSNASSI